MILKRGFFLKRAQLALFIIFGLFLLTAFIFFIIFYQSENSFFKPQKKSLGYEITGCIEKSIKEAEDDFFKNKEFIEIFPVHYVYLKEKVPFVCYSTDFYSSCIPQSPLFIELIRKKMENRVAKELSRCILLLKEDYESKGYSFDYKKFDFSLNFFTNSIYYEATIPLKVTRGEENFFLSKLNGEINAALPVLLRTAETIINYESSLCEFDYAFWQTINRGLEIDRFKGGDQTKVYSIRSLSHKKEIKIAIRTCVLPAGI